MQNFEKLGLIKPLLQALSNRDYTEPTPIQSQSIPPVLEGNDLLGLAQTGTGKTAAFSLPTIQRLLDSKFRASPRGVRALILAPTRELTDQISTSFKAYAGSLPMAISSVVGGVAMGKQIRDLQRGLDVLVATPGRLMDLHRRGAIHFDDLEIFILDEADQMLDLGFIHTLKELAELLPKERQTLLFSATMPKEISGLARKFLRDPVEVKVAPAATTAEKVEQKIAHVDGSQKKPLLLELLKDESIESVLVFTRTRHGATKLSRIINAAGLKAEAIHGDRSQQQRQKTLASFKSGRLKILVATDVAARGIDISGISHVINYDMPNVAENYVHRIGRTARAGREGIAITFCLPEDRGMLTTIEHLTRQKIDELDGYGWFMSDSVPQKARGGRGKGAGKGKNKNKGAPKKKSGSAQGKSTPPKLVAAKSRGPKKPSKPASAKGGKPSAAAKPAKRSAKPARKPNAGSNPSANSGYLKRRSS
ncbi:DEAD/DEAH box helicase [Flexibacterium corallicola]|uniref:DEAD/DEAH box helicase n=1 Tax=Flexibacterium corallicola TaxID=3037259 RepID=UPI00286F3C58|nr:DEAD/DEAH box helicase [Pseudovibrio sp. M1P-2-3]